MKWLRVGLWGEWFEAEDFKVVVLGARGGDIGGDLHARSIFQCEQTHQIRLIRKVKSLIISDKKFN